MKSPSKGVAPLSNSLKRCGASWSASVIRTFESTALFRQELSRHAGCTRQTTIALEQGKYVPSIKLAFGLARAFGVTIEEVFQYGETE